MQKIALITVLSLIISFCALTMPGLVEIQGHRGCRGNFPENTLPAFRHALDSSIDVLEMDLAVTKDRVLVISHDPHINPELCRHGDGRALERPLLIHELTLEEVKSFDCGSVQHKNFQQQQTIPGTTIPTLAEVFALVREAKTLHSAKIGFNIETKIFPEHPEYTVGPEEFAALVVNEIRESGFLSRTTLQSFDPRVLVAARILEPELRRVMLIEDETIDMAKQGFSVGAYAISPDVNLLSQKRVISLQRQGFKVIPWTVNTKDEWGHVIEWGVDGIITDYPLELQKFSYDRYFTKRVDAAHNFVLYHDEIAEPHARAIAGVLQTSTVKELSLNNNKLGTRTALLAPGLLVSTVESLSLMVNEVDDESVVAIAHALKENKSIRKLSFYNNNIGDIGAVALANLLMVNGVIESLSLQQNIIRDDGAIALAEALKHNHSLKILDLCGNKISDDGTRAIATALSRNASVTNLLIDTYSHELKEIISRELEANHFREQCRTTYPCEWEQLKKLVRNDVLTTSDQDDLLNIVSEFLKISRQ